MKIKTILSTLIVSVLSLVACELYAQETNEAARRAKTNTDSIQQVQQQLNKEAIDNAKEAKDETKAIEKEAVRVKREASDASSQSKKALKMEKNAQKSRRNADQQSRKASEAREKSDRN